MRGMMGFAAGAEELNASVREISAAMSKSRETAMTAVDRVEAADQRAQRPALAAESMSSIVQLIGDITGQSICWRSTPPSNSRAPARPVAALPWLPPRSRILANPAE